MLELETAMAGSSFLPPLSKYAIFDDSFRANGVMDSFSFCKRNAPIILTHSLSLYEHGMATHSHVYYLQCLLLEKW